MPEIMWRVSVLSGDIGDVGELQFFFISSIIIETFCLCSVRGYRGCW